MAEAPPKPKTVRETLGANVREIRGARMTGREFISRLDERGVKLLPSGLTALEKGERRVTAEELLVIAVVLNTSVIDLLTPRDGSPLEVAEGIEPIPWAWLESWMSGTTPWPPDPTNAKYTEEFFDTASERRKIKHRTDMRPELQELSVLRSAVAGAIDGPSELNQIHDPEDMAAYLRDQLERVNSYVNLLADHVEKNGYGPR